jgi:uncharacterized membrane protein YhaH (DUF805 family)
MGTFTQSLANGLGGLTRFSGRDRPRLFWPYAGAVFGLNMVVSVVAFVPFIQDVVRRMQRFVVEHPELVTVVDKPGHYSVQIDGFHPDLMPNLWLLVAPMAFAALVSILLLAAATVRRLHDRDRPGYWGLLPLPFLAFGMVGMMVMVDRLVASLAAGGTADFGLLSLLFLNNAFYLAALGILIVQLASNGTRGPNRYGPDPLDGEAARTV